MKLNKNVVNYLPRNAISNYGLYFIVCKLFSLMHMEFSRNKSQ